jgi:hypothetical protein
MERCDSDHRLRWRQLREHDTYVLMERLVQDIRLAGRSLRRSPTFTVTAVLILGLGMGMSVAMWTVFHAVLLRHLPVVSPHRVVLPRALNQLGADLALTHADVDQIRHAARTMQEISAFEHFGAYEIPKLDGDRPLPLAGTQVDGGRERYHSRPCRLPGCRAPDHITAVWGEPHRPARVVECLPAAARRRNARGGLASTSGYED